jgi:SPP1 gp7 family putative phage head morphogenesis protein
VCVAAQLDTANRLRRRVDALEKRGATIPEAKSELNDVLRDLGCEPARAPQPVIQEEIQKRFARTRSEILSLDFYRAAYPFWRYVATLDERTTQGCRALDGLTMPASDPQWVGFVPPRHWRCRAHVVAVVHSVGAQARKTQPDEQYAGDGSFGTLIEEWEPRPGDYPQDLWEIYAARKSLSITQLSSAYVAGASGQDEKLFTASYVAELPTGGTNNSAKTCCTARRLFWTTPKKSATLCDPFGVDGTKPSVKSRFKTLLAKVFKNTLPAVSKSCGEASP